MSDETTASFSPHSDGRCPACRSVDVGQPPLPAGLQFDLLTLAGVRWGRSAGSDSLFQIKSTHWRRILSGTLRPFECTFTVPVFGLASTSVFCQEQQTEHDLFHCLWASTEQRKASQPPPSTPDCPRGSSTGCLRHTRRSTPDR